MVKELLLATRNAHKTREIAAMLGPGWRVQDLTALPEFPEPDETGATFLANAEIKARSASARTGALVLADDSGLEVDALGGAPGVYSARYAGEKASDADHRRKLSAELARAGVAESPGRFQCALVAARDGVVAATFQDSVEGTVVARAAGAGGFGYDPQFIPAGHAQTLAQFTPEAKNALSHRGRALQQFAAWAARNFA